MVHVGLASLRPRKPAKYTGLRVTGQYGIDGRPVQAVLADDLALEFHDRYAYVEALFPLGTAVDVADLDLQMAAHERQQLLEEDVAKVAATPAVQVKGGSHGVTDAARHSARRSA